MLVVIFMGGLMPNMDVHELAKLPRMVEHFYEHHSENEKFNFISFLELHYGNSKEANEHQSKHDDSNLPFHGHTCPAVLFTLSERFNYVFFAFIVKTELNSSYRFPGLPEVHTSLFLPPKA